jgi:(p)ppGpp synthase/HD superfamily hydrolase
MNSKKSSAPSSWRMKRTGAGAQSGEPYIDHPLNVSEILVTSAGYL